MEFHVKLQELRKQKGLTQDALAEALYVSRTAISKWESGRGYPNIDSLKAIAKYFSVTVDELLTGEELLSVAQKDAREKERKTCDLVYGLLDCGALSFLFLPLFAQGMDTEIQAVSLVGLSFVAPYLQTLFWVVILGIALWGIGLLALQNCQKSFWLRIKSRFSVLLSMIGTMLFFVSRQPYAALFFFMFLMIKLLMLVKKH